MNLPHDLKNFHPAEDAFQILTPDQCVLILCALAGFAAIFWPYF